MSKTRLPASIRHFVEQQTTLPVATLWKPSTEDRVSPYGSFWYRATACILLSGRVHPKIAANDDPHMTDLNRIGKEANFNHYLLERAAKFLVAADVIKGDFRREAYAQGPNLEPFWAQDPDRLTQMSREAVLRLVEQ